jgi:epsilon-lactone hydrolase
VNIRMLRLGAIAAFGCASLQPPSSARPVPQHDLPIPTTVSPQFQALIAKAPVYEVPRTTPTTNAGWLALTNPHPEQVHQTIVTLLARLDTDMQEQTIAGVHCYIITPKAPRPGRLLVHVHGGGYVTGGGEAGLGEAIMVAGTTRIKTIAVDYRMPPDYPFPAPVDDAFAVWTAVSAKATGGKIGIFGSSTGGAMVLEVTQRAIAERARVPDAVIAGTPWSDISETGDSYFTNKYADPLVYTGNLEVMARQYAHGLDLKDPRLSPVYGSFDRFPPTLLLSGTRDLLLSDTVRVDRKLRDAGAQSELIVYEGESHGAYGAGLDYAETQTYLRDVSGFIDRRFAVPPVTSTKR